VLLAYNAALRDNHKLTFQRKVLSSSLKGKQEFTLVHERRDIFTNFRRLISLKKGAFTTLLRDCPSSKFPSLC
jgi:hypothetical protein